LDFRGTGIAPLEFSLAAAVRGADLRDILLDDHEGAGTERDPVCTDGELAPNSVVQPAGSLIESGLVLKH